MELNWASLLFQGTDQDIGTLSRKTIDRETAKGCEKKVASISFGTMLIY